MRVIAGTFRGRRLVAPKGNRVVRPTADRVKESVFSMLREQVIDANFLDLCAGTGNMGIEALSRGAKHVTFLERDPRCIQIIKQNLRTCGLTTEPRAARKPTDTICLLRRDVVKGITYLQKQAAVFEVIYFDPPYAAGLQGGAELYTACLALLAENSLLRTSGILLVEHAKQFVIPDTVGSLTRNRQAHYGDTVVSFYKKEIVDL
ncbi:MAG: 16S rRNA (guanine(966)-N(2))-methyltransferase RsmD [Candidatus Poribacteria bacterium]|nr:16S rRNA (guanine(966)-N(2))-methyltransferase RsmD [Candidatus Poribacteria bacterium]